MNRKLTLAAMTLLLMTSAAAYADTVTFTLTPPAGFVPAAGGTATYDATVSAPASNGAPVYLNGDSFNAPSPLTLDDSDFFSNFPFYLNPGTSFNGDIFAVTIPANTPAGTYSGFFTLEGGPTDTSSNVLGTVDFTTTVTPEPSSFLLLGTGLAGAFATLKRRRFSKV